MIERDPLDRGRLERRMRVTRDARREALRVNAMQREKLERDLKDLDDAIVGFDHLQLEQLRQWSRRLDEQSLEQEQQQDRELKETFPASDTPAHLAPGSSSHAEGR